MVRGVSHFLRIAQKGRRDPLAQQKNNAHPIARSKQDERRELILSARHSLHHWYFDPQLFRAFDCHFVAGINMPHHTCTRIIR